MLLGLTAFAALLSLGACAWLRHPKFGPHSEGVRLERVQRSPNYADGAFRNEVDTPTLAATHATARISMGSPAGSAASIWWPSTWDSTTPGGP